MPKLSELRGAQPAAVARFSHAIEHGRLHHAYLLVGVHATSLRRLAESVAQSLVCQSRHGVDACGECAACRKAASGNHPDIQRVAPSDKDSIAIAPIRELSARLALRAVEASTKIVHIERACLMNTAAQNALLKTLEEPPGATCFLLTATRPRRLLPTIRSRCQLVRLAPAAGGAAELEAAGIETGLAAILAPLAQGDAERALAWVEAGAADVLEALRRALEPGASVIDALDVAAELGSDKAQTEMATALLELRLRDALAVRHGATAATPEALARLAAPAVPAAALRGLQRLRKMATLNMNRPMALEGLFLTWTGKGELDAQR